MNLLSCLRADFYKCRRSALRLIHLFVPAAGAAVFLGYYLVSAWDEGLKLTAYIQALSVSFPALIGIITAMEAEREQNAGNFQQLLSLPAAKYLPQLSRLILLTTLGLFSSLLALTLFGAGFIKMGCTAVGIGFYLKCGAMLALSVLPLYLLNYLIGFVFGKGFGIGLGVFGSLLTALLRTGLGDGIWWMLPWGLAARFSVSAASAELGGIEFLRCGDIMKAVFSLIIYSAAFAALFLLVFNNWQGRASE